MRLSIDNIIDKHKDCSAIVLCHGPSLNSITNNLEYFKNSGSILIGCNEWFCFYKTVPNYWVVASSEFTIERHFRTINKYSESTLVYADSVDTINKEKANSLLKNNYISYDQRHFNNKECGWVHEDGSKPKCCDNIEKGRLTIQEILRNYCNGDICYSGGSTVALHCIALSILLGCKNIYLYGIDLDYRLGYANNNAGMINLVQENWFDPHMDINMNDFKSIKNLAKRNDVMFYPFSLNEKINDIFRN